MNPNSMSYGLEQSDFFHNKSKKMSEMRRILL